MSERRHVIDRSEAFAKDYGLIYTCNLGWIDLSHMNPKSTRPHTGAAGLWREISAGGPDVRWCKGAHRQICTSSGNAGSYPAVTFSKDGATGFKVAYMQDMQKKIFGAKLSSGVKREYAVRHKLSVAQLKSVALAIFMEVSLEFEGHQEFFPGFITDSGFSQEDLVSNLISFHIAVGTVTKAQVLALARPVSKETALKIWDRHGAVGSRKNRGFKPMFSPDICVSTDKVCVDECGGVVPHPPEFLSSILPEKKGELFINNILGSS